MPSLSYSFTLMRLRFASSIQRPVIPNHLNSHYYLFLPRGLHRKMSSTTTVPSSQPVCTLSSLDHLVLTVRSLPETIKFYTEVLGMAHQSFTSPKDPNTTRHALLFGNQKINLHQAGKEFEPKALKALPGTADLCFLSNEDVSAVLKKLVERGIEVLEGGEVVKRTGARSPLNSVYVRDPDGNLIEISNPTV